MTWYVYALCHPLDGEIHYVGKSKNPSARLLQHISERAAVQVRAWVEALGGLPSLRILSIFDCETDALKEDQRLIAEIGQDVLLNVCSRGVVATGRHVEFSGIGKRIATLRKELGITMMELEDSAGIANGNLSKIERGLRVSVTAETAVRLARALGATVEYLVTGERLASEAAA